MTETNNDVLLRRSPDQEAGRLRIAGCEFPLTAWAVLDGQIDVLEVVDAPQNMLRVSEWMLRPCDLSIITADGAVRQISHIPDEAGSWAIGKRNPLGVAVGYYFSAPVGRFVMEAEFALPGAELAGTLERAMRPLSILTSIEPRTLLMLAGPQALPASEDERLLAGMLSGLLRDCYQLPLPPSPTLEVELWRALIAAPEEQGAARPAQRRRDAVVDMEGNVVQEAEEIRDSEHHPVRRAADGGLRAWRVSRYTRDVVEHLLPRFAKNDKLRERIRDEVLPAVCADDVSDEEDDENGDA